MKLALLMVLTIGSTSVLQSACADGAIPIHGWEISIPICSLKDLPPGYEFQGNAFTYLRPQAYLPHSIHQGLSLEDHERLSLLARFLILRGTAQAIEREENPETAYMRQITQPLPPYSEEELKGLEYDTPLGKTTLTPQDYERVRTLIYQGIQSRVSGPDRGKIDFGGGVVVESLSKLVQECGPPRALSQNIPSDRIVNQMRLYTDFRSNTQTFVTLTGMMSHKEKAKVKAEVLIQPFWFAMEPRVERPDDLSTPAHPNPKDRPDILPAGTLSLVISRQEPNGTLTELGRHSESVAFGVDRLWRIETAVDPSTRIQAQLIVNTKNQESMKEENYVLVVQLKKASLFGAQCYPDFSNPEKCL